ncbi:hypothetical protein ABW21_db0201172 [Orbilia brochopaga]|nr:hypothetical protein ABW21_db0201172 [Drechslerella brochopaga]
MGISCDNGPTCMAGCWPISAWPRMAAHGRRPKPRRRYRNQNLLMLGGRMRRFCPADLASAGVTMAGKPLTSGPSCQRPAGHDGIVTVIHLGILNREGNNHGPPPNLPPSKLSAAVPPCWTVATAGSRLCDHSHLKPTDRQTAGRTLIHVERERADIIIRRAGKTAQPAKPREWGPGRRRDTLSISIRQRSPKLPSISLFKSGELAWTLRR